MVIDPLFLYFFTTAVIVLGVLVLALLTYYIRLTTVLKETFARYADAELSLQKKENKVLVHAHKTAHTIVEQAEEQAMETTRDYSQKEAALLASFAQTLETLQQEMLTQTKETYQKLFTHLAKQFEQAAEEEVQLLRNSLQHETLQTEKAVADKVEEAYAIMLKDIDLRKQEKLANVEKDIQQIIQKTCHDVIGESLSLSQQQALVVEALEKAKQELKTPSSLCLP